MVAPSKLAHIVFRTNRLQDMVNWYCTVLEASPVYGDSRIVFISYDEEHHRVAFVASERYQEKSDGLSVGFYHSAFSYRNLAELLGTYERLKGLGIVAWRPLLHGPTVSMYYRDPDGNDVELQVDAFPDAESATRYMQGEAFARNPVGEPFDPEIMLERHRAGVPEAELMRRSDS